MINRLARLDASQAWDGDLNPTQTAVLEYLSRANRFSKSPSHVADFLGTTRGTISQSLKSLAQKGYVAERKSSADKRVVSFELIQNGYKAAQSPSQTAIALSKMDTKLVDDLSRNLEMLLAQLLSENNGRAFGVCQNCIHFSKRSLGGHCKLLSQDLTQEEKDQICHEQQPA